MLPGSSVSGSPNPVRRVAVILELLLDGVPTPDQLKALVSRNVADPPESQTVAEFAHAVSFFERPGRGSDIQALVERASAASERTRADEELRRLQAKALEASERAPAEPKKDPKAQRRLHPLVLIGGLTLVVSVLTGAGTWYGLIGKSAETNQTRHPVGCGREHARCGSGVQACGSWRWFSVGCRRLETRHRTRVAAVPSGQSSAERSFLPRGVHDRHGSARTRATSSRRRLYSDVAPADRLRVLQQDRPPEAPS